MDGCDTVDNYVDCIVCLYCMALHVSACLSAEGATGHHLLRCLSDALQAEVSENAYRTD